MTNAPINILAILSFQSKLLPFTYKDINTKISIQRPINLRVSMNDKKVVNDRAKLWR